MKYKNEIEENKVKFFLTSTV